MLIESLLPWNAWHCCETLARLVVVRSGGQVRDMCECEPGAGHQHQQVESGHWTPVTSLISPPPWTLTPDTVAWVHDEMHGTRWHELNRGGALTIAGCDHDDVWLQQRTYAEEEDWYSSFWGSGYTWSIKGFKLKLYILHALHTCIMKIE